MQDGEGRFVPSHCDTKAEATGYQTSNYFKKAKMTCQLRDLQYTFYTLCYIMLAACACFMANHMLQAANPPISATASATAAKGITGGRGLFAMP